MKNKIKATNVTLKRAYEPPTDHDGKRILVDRLWPRGVSKADTVLYEWMKDIAPSTELRKWFGHDPARWPEFQQRYREELRNHPEQIRQLRTLAGRGAVTLVYSAQDEVHNDAVVLRSFLLGRLPPKAAHQKTA